jgi:hypothetical protein
VRRNLDGRVHAAAGGAANQQRNLLDAEVLVLLHLAGHVLHLFQAGRDEARQAHDVGALDLGARQDLVAGHHHAHVHHLEVVALQDHGDDVLADVVHVALDGGDDDLALGLDVAPGGLAGAFLPRCRAAGAPRPASSRGRFSPPGAGTSCPAPNRSPTTFMPSISGPSITCSGRPPLARMAR